MTMNVLTAYGDLNDKGEPAVVIGIQGRHFIIDLEMVDVWMARIAASRAQAVELKEMYQDPDQRAFLEMPIAGLA